MTLFDILLNIFEEKNSEGVNNLKKKKKPIELCSLMEHHRVEKIFLLNIQVISNDFDR